MAFFCVCSSYCALFSLCRQQAELEIVIIRNGDTRAKIVISIPPLGAISLIFLMLLPQRSGLSIVPLSVVAGTDMSVVLVSYAGLTQVLGVVASGVVLWVLNTRHTAVTKEVANGW